MLLLHCLPEDEGVNQPSITRMGPSKRHKKIAQFVLGIHFHLRLLFGSLYRPLIFAGGGPVPMFNISTEKKSPNNANLRLPLKMVLEITATSGWQKCEEENYLKGWNNGGYGKDNRWSEVIENTSVNF